MSKISRKTHFPEGLFFASGGIYRALRPMSIPLSKNFLFFFFSTGDDRDRTDNLCLARAALSQLSYVPELPADSPSRLSAQQPHPIATSVTQNMIEAPFPPDSPAQQSAEAPKETPHITKPEPVGVRGLEPRTSALSELRSNHLSYTPRKLFPNSGADILPAFGPIVQSPVAEIFEFS